MITFAGNRKPSWLIVNKMEHSVLPSIDYKNIAIMSKPGAWDFGTQVKVRELSFNVQIIGEDQYDVMKKSKALAEWLLYDELQPLIVDDEPDKQYMARFYGDSVIDELFNVGTTTLKFIVPQPYHESITPKEKSFTITDENPVQVTNDGTAPTYGIIDLTMKAASTNIAVVSDEGYVSIGTPEDVEKTTADKATSATILTENFRDGVVGWTTAVAIEDGTIQGEFAQNPDSWDVKDGNYGTGTKWHGPAAIKSLSKELQDFEITMNVGFNDWKAAHIGRIELYLLDKNNVTIGKLSIADTNSNYPIPKLYARAGSPSDYKQFASYGPSRFKTKKVNGKKVSDSVGVYSSMLWGVLRIGRKGNTWTAYIANLEDDLKSKNHGSHLNAKTFRWVDTKKKYMGKVAKVQVHIGSFGTKQPVPNSYVSYLKVVDKSITTAANEIPVELHTGDVVRIDNEKAIVYLNGEPCYGLLDPSSSFFALEKGINGLAVSPPVADMKVTYTERWL